MASRSSENLPDGWNEAFQQSQWRYRSKGGWFNARGPIRACFEPEKCPLRRGKNIHNARCIVSMCILEFPTVEDLMEFVK